MLTAASPQRFFTSCLSSVPGAKQHSRYTSTPNHDLNLRDVSDRQIACVFRPAFRFLKQLLFGGLNIDVCVTLLTTLWLARRESTGAEEVSVTCKRTTRLLGMF